MPKKKFKVTFCMLSISLLFSGCSSSMGTGVGKKNDEKLIKRELQGTGVALGAVAGAVIGGRQGAVVGAAAGNLAGDYLADKTINKKKMYASQESQLKAKIAEINNATKKVEKINRTLELEIKNLQSETIRLKNQLANQELKYARIKDRLKKSEKVHRLAVKSLDDVHQKLNKTNENVVHRHLDSFLSPSAINHANSSYSQSREAAIENSGLLKSLQENIYRQENGTFS